MKQRMIVVDGVSGVGKDTFAEHLVYRMQTDIGKTVVLTKEPTDGFYGERGLLRLSKGLNDLETAMLMLMDRHVHMTEIHRENEPGAIFVMNRYGLSTLAYQLPEFINFIIEAHKFFPIPDLTILLDATHEKWISGNREWFIMNGFGDRGNYRTKLKNEVAYYELRDSYFRHLSGVTSHIVGKGIVLEGFRDLDQMVDDVMPTVIKAINGDLVSDEAMLSRNAVRSAIENFDKGRDTVSNKQAMEKAEECIQSYLESIGSFTTKEISESLRDYPISKIIGNVVQNLRNKDIIKINKIKEVGDDSSGKQSHSYVKGIAYKTWHPGI